MARYGCHAPLSTCRRRLRRCVCVFLAQALVLLNSKCLSLYKQKKKPGQLTWTQAWRRLNKKGKTITVTRRRNRKTTKFVRAVTGATKAEVRGCWGRVLGVSCTVCMLGCLYWGVLVFPRWLLNWCSHQIDARRRAPPSAKASASAKEIAYVM